MVTYKGKEFWCGSVSLIDGYIEEVHSYEEAKIEDFHHTFYFSEPQVIKINEEENAFFWFEKGETSPNFVMDDIPVWISEKILEQVIIDS